LFVLQKNVLIHKLYTGCSSQPLNTDVNKGSSWSWSYGSWIYNYQMQSVPITTNVVSSIPTQAIQHYVIQFVSDLRQDGGFLQVLRFPPPIKVTATIWLKYCWKWY